MGLLWLVTESGWLRLRVSAEGRVSGLADEPYCCSVVEVNPLEPE